MDLFILTALLLAVIVYRVPRALTFGKQLLGLTSLVETVPDHLSDDVREEIEDVIDNEYPYLKYAGTLFALFGLTFTSFLVMFDVFKGADVAQWVVYVWAGAGSACIFNLYLYPFDTRWTSEMTVAAATDVFTTQFKSLIKAQQELLVEIDKVRETIPNVDTRDGTEVLSSDEAEAYKKLMVLYVQDHNLKKQIAACKEGLDKLPQLPQE